ncbi:MAG: hypothetical protein EOO60_03340 [Hymenobacter sp.]|nr:MAG: hypothetical protein EOO60_03340 [Hymenobacter sp.]
MASRPLLSAPLPSAPTTWPYHTAKVASLPAHLLMRGDRRLEGDVYLTSGYGVRLALEAQPAGWVPLGQLARVWQPGRLKGIQVGPQYGTPFLAATQVLDFRPSPRKFLALDRTDDAANRFVKPGTILITCSGNVGKATLAVNAHEKLLISHDLLRIETAKNNWGWVYAYLRSPQARAMMSAAQYGHVIKHLEVGHLEKLPVPQLTPKRLATFQAGYERILEARNRSFELLQAAETKYADLFPGFTAVSDDVVGFSASSAQMGGRRLRMEATYHAPSVQHIHATYQRHARAVVSLASVTEKIIVPGRFKHVYGDGGTPYIDSADLLEVNPDITKYVLKMEEKEQAQYHVEAGWLLVPCSGQVYGNIGHVVLATQWHTQKMLTNHALRIAPDTTKIRAGYLQCVLGHPQLGRPQTVRFAFGASVPEIAAADVALVPVPRFASKIENELANMMEESAILRSEADTLENHLAAEAEALLDRFIAGERLD